VSASLPATSRGCLVPDLGILPRLGIAPWRSISSALGLDAPAWARAPRPGRHPNRACFQTFNQGKVLPQLVEERCRELLTRIHNQVGKLSISIKAKTKHQTAYPLNSGLLPCLCCINNFMPKDPVEPLIKVWRPKYMIFKFKGLLEPFMEA